MNEKTFRVLEYNKIVEILRGEITSSLGREILKNFKPSGDKKRVMESQKETSEASEIIIKSANIPMGPIYDIGEYIKISEIGSFLYPGQLLKVSDCLRTARNFKKFILSFNEEEIKYPILYGYANSISTFKNIEDRINLCIINESEISDKASSTLYQIRRSIERTNGDIRKKLDSLIRSVDNQKYLQDSIVTIRQERFVVPVKVEHKNNVKGLIHDQSSSGSTLYIEPIAVVELNNQLKELRLKETKEIEKILKELSALVGEKAMEIKINQKNIAYLDFIFGKGKLSVSMGGVEPIINDRGYIRLKNARHPLIKKNEVVKNTIVIGDDFSTLLITGPNTGGKTVTLKTTGLLILMAQSGLHIPTDYGTEISIFENIFADIGDEQSIEQSLSTFSSHMNNIVEILEKAGGNSLVLLDELGAGTDPTEGAALAMSILSYLHSCQVKTVATTHYSELKHFALINEGIENACVEFDVATLRPTYKLLIGVPGKSNAFEISRKLGLNDDIIEHAKIFLNKDNIEFEDILSSIEKNRRDAEEERDEAIRLRLQVEKLKNKLSEKEEKLTVQKDKILRQAKQEAKDILKKAKSESEKIIKELRSFDQISDKDKNKRIEELRKNIKNELSSVESSGYEDLKNTYKPPKKLSIGQLVKIVNLDQKGIVLTNPDSSGNLRVQVGIMKINVNLKDLSLIEDKINNKKNIRYSKEYISKTANISPEIDLRGMNVEEASFALDKYLDDAYLSSLEEVRLIHGKGTGALKKGLKEFFRKHPHIKSFRDGDYTEGGIGVTIAKIK